MLPVVAVALSAPPTVDAAKFNPASFTTVALPVPLVVKATVPSTASVPILITPLLASVVAARLPPTVTVPRSVIPDALPLLTVRSPSIVDAARISAVVPPSFVTSASVFASSFVVIVTAPVNAFVVVSRCDRCVIRTGGKSRCSCNCKRTVIGHVTGGCRRRKISTHRCCREG